VALVALTLGYLAMTAYATNWGAGATDPSYSCLKVGDRNPDEYWSECTAEDEDLYVYVDGDVPAWFRDAVATSIVEDYNPLPGFAATLQSALNDNTDTRVRKKDIPPAPWPAIYTTCSGTADFGGGSGEYRWCRRQIMFLEPGRLNQNRKHMYACHELGHSAGLAHPQPLQNNPRDTCMDYDWDTDDLDAHDEQHLVDCYPRPNPAPYTLTPKCRDYQTPSPCPGAGTGAPCP
jgi:hypothetical protein